jgi:hypothetical protein
MKPNLEERFCSQNGNCLEEERDKPNIDVYWDKSNLTTISMTLIEIGAYHNIITKLLKLLRKSTTKI